MMRPVVEARLIEDGEFPTEAKIEYLVLRHYNFDSQVALYERWEPKK